MKLKGNDLQLYRQDGGKLVAAARSCNVNVKCDTVEVSRLGDAGWKKFIAGIKSWDMDCSWLVSSGQILKDNIGMVGMVLAVKVVIDGKQLKGECICKTCKVTGTRGNLVQGSFQFTGSGALS